MMTISSIYFAAILWAVVSAQESVTTPEENVLVTTAGDNILITTVPSDEVNSSTAEPSMDNTNQPDPPVNEFCFSKDVNKTYGYKITILTLKNRNTSKVLMQRYVTEEFKTCQKLGYTRDEIEDMGNGTVVFVNTTLTFDCFNHLPWKNFTYICKINPEQNSTPLTDFILLTYVGLSISILCLLLHLINFLRLKELRNLPGSNLASLSVALLSAYFFFLIGQVPEIINEPCVAISVIAYFSFLAAFFWMNVISFDVMRALYLATKKLQVPPSKFPVRRFVGYSVYAWGLPMVGVIASVVYDKNSVEVGPTSYRPKFGTYLCWFNNANGLLVFLASPVFVLIGANTLCFVLSSYFVCSSSKSNLSAMQRRSLTIDFVLYMKLAVIMGLTWIIGIIAGSVDHPSLWYIFVILNSLQGFFIFLAFSCGKFIGRFFKSLKQKVRKVSLAQSSTLTSC